MSKILLINAHPNPAKSVANNAVIAEVTRRLPEITAHNIADSCRNGAFDLALEHKLLTDHDIIVFQFPLYWGSRCRGFSNSGLTTCSPTALPTARAARR
ncbi:NAD(P)H-dependent oxidoreductase [Duodenibacillus massiliensis]|uniref:NAD(P)H-dependent oxidoreductase n=1 Tax=Duodenibacillus massiliensis TaxID=1852381 RepID=UPI00307C468A